MNNKARFALAGLVLSAASTSALAHVDVGANSSFTAGFGHPFGGLDHLTAMVAAGMWAALKGGRALWAWPAAFVGVMLVGGVLGMAQIVLPLVEPTILASVMTIGLLLALVADLPVWLGAVMIGSFAVFHGHAHGSEIPEGVAGFTYIAGFAMATAALHFVGIGATLGLARLRWQPLVRLAGAACVLIGIGMAAGVI